MKAILLILGFVTVATATSIAVRVQDPESIYKELLSELMKEHDTKNPIAVNINDYLDSTLPVVRNWIINNGLDPIEVEALENEFIWTISLIQYRGKLSLNNGLLHGISTIQRAGDATMTCESKILQIYLPLTFDTILINYDYKLKFLGLEPSGGVEGKIKNLNIIVDIAVDTATLQITLQGFRISDSGKITVRFSGNPLTDFIANIITSIATPVLHNVALHVIQNDVRIALETVIENINNSTNPSSLLY